MVDYKELNQDQRDRIVVGGTLSMAYALLGIPPKARVEGKPSDIQIIGTEIVRVMQMLAKVDYDDLWTKTLYEKKSDYMPTFEGQYGLVKHEQLLTQNPHLLSPGTILATVWRPGGSHAAEEYDSQLHHTELALWQLTNDPEKYEGVQSFHSIGRQIRILRFLRPNKWHSLPRFKTHESFPEINGRNSIDSADYIIRGAIIPPQK